MKSIFAYADKGLQKRLSELVVLVADDQPEVRSLICAILTEAGVGRIFEAADGKAAMSLMDTDFDMVNFVICDWQMPGMQGIDLLRQLRTTNPSIPFLMVTSRSDKNSVLDARKAGVSAYIRKPFSPKQLEEKLKILLEQTMPS